MESQVEKIVRLVGALEILSNQLFGALNAGDYPGALGIQDRCQPVLDEISRLMVEPGLARSLDPATRERVDRLLKNQLDQVERIEADKSVLREELKGIRTAQTRTQRFRSAYGKPGYSSPSGNYAETG